MFFAQLTYSLRTDYVTIKHYYLINCAAVTELYTLINSTLFITLGLQSFQLAESSKPFPTSFLPYPLPLLVSSIERGNYSVYRDTVSVYRFKPKSVGEV